MTAVRKTTARIFTLIAIALASLLSSPGCETLMTGPQVTRQEIRHESHELEKRKQEYKTRKQASPFASKDLKQQEELVREIGTRLLREVANPPKITFHIQKNEAVNAGATIGQIVVTTAMMNFLRSEDELAMVLGHEIAHITRGHITRSIIYNLPVIIGSQVAESAAPGSGRVVEMAGGIFTQKFSRDMEREADYFGIHYAHNAGYNAAAGIEIWERFAIELPASQQTTIFSSHPSSTERMIRARKIAATLRGQGKVAIPQQ